MNIQHIFIHFIPLGMFYILDNGTDYWFNMFSFENEANFRLIGILLGLAIYNSIILDVHFPITVYRKLLNCTPTLDDLEASHLVSYLIC